MAEQNAEIGITPQQDEPSGLQIVYVSTFPPRICGIATFTQDLTNAIDSMLAPAVTSRIAAMNPHQAAYYKYPQKVIFEINQDNPEEYISTAEKINRMDSVQLVSIQHEFGIFGGKRGSNIIPFVQELTKPVCITFHTVLPNPNKSFKNPVVQLAENASAIIVMTSTSKEILSQDYSVPKKKIKVIPHGIHPQAYTSSEQAKKRLGYPGKVVLSTFGLLSRIKGLEYVIEALPKVIREHPDFVYIFFGATHPAILHQEGESYRRYLIEKISSLELNDYVKLYNRYFPLKEMLSFLRATDIYISPSLEPNQAVSGTLSYALGTGRPVISTAFTQAREVITDEVGLLVDFKSPDMYAKAMIRLIKDKDSRIQMGKNAYFRTRNWTWPNVAVQYSRVFAEQAPRLAQISDQKSLPRIKLDYLIHLTDNFGIVQFAILSKRDISSGYTLDDNARALTAMSLYWEKLGSQTQNPSVTKPKRVLLKLIRTYLDFISFVSSPDGQFSNFVKADRTLDDDQNRQINLEESNTRAIFALTLTASTPSLPVSIKRKALEILQKRINNGISCASPRAIAYCIISLCILINRKIPLDKINLEKALRTQANHLIKLYKASSHNDWQWFEPYLTYSNGIMPEAMLMAYDTTKDARYLKIGKTTLDFLIEKSFIDDVFMPIGQAGWYHHSGKRHRYDQQPEEVRAIVYALKAGYAVTGDEKYHQLMRKAFYWFLGDNSLHQVVYDQSTGGCYDGVGRKNINLNQGAESTISYLTARLAFD